MKIVHRAAATAAPAAVASVRRLAHVTATMRDAVRLTAQNLWSRRDVTGDAAVVVSLASFGRRKRTAYLTIESLARGAVRPRQLILCLDGEDEQHPLPRTLRRLQRRGLSVIYADATLGPHKKYYPYVASSHRETAFLPLVTADDDVLYPRTWLAHFAAGTQRFTAGEVACYRARTVRVRSQVIEPYGSWAVCESDQPSFLTFPTGVSGRYCPRGLIDALRVSGEGFRASCPRADDVWLHAIALRHGIKARQLATASQHFPQIPGSQVASLFTHNVVGGQNDAQIRATYSPADVAVLVAAAAQSSATTTTGRPASSTRDD